MRRPQWTPECVNHSNTLIGVSGADVDSLSTRLLKLAYLDITT